MQRAGIKFKKTWESYAKKHDIAPAKFKNAEIRKPIAAILCAFPKNDAISTHTVMTIESQKTNRMSVDLTNELLKINKIIIGVAFKTAFTSNAFFAPKVEKNSN
jgi:hypothetical protein